MSRPSVECQILASLILLLTNWLFLSDTYFNVTILEFLSITTIIFACFWFISFITSVSSYLFLLINFLLLLFCSVINYYKLNYKIAISTSLIESVFGTDIGEVSELFNLSVFLWIAFFTLVPFIFIILLIKCNIKNSSKKLYISFSAFILLIFISVTLLPNNIYKPRYLVNSICTFMPFNYVLAAKNFLSARYKQKSRIDITNHFTFDINNNDKDALNVILVIGESARFDRFAINGYERNTTPNLSKIKNLITYTNTYSLATTTAQGIQKIMQMDNRNDLSSFIQIFNKLGFQTYWFSNQSTRYRIINEIASEASNFISSDDIRVSKVGNNYDMDLLSYVKDVLPKNKLNMIILHTIGSHRLYDLRYPPEFQKFKPTCISENLYYTTNECVDKEKLNNSYDNSIVYTDYFLSELIGLLNKTNSFLIYLSDHGESLGENGVYAHASPLESAPPEQLHIPLFVWASDSFLSQRNHQVFFNQINQNRSLKIDQSYVFHSILDCVGITSESIDVTKSICRSKHSEGGSNIVEHNYKQKTF